MDDKTCTFALMEFSRTAPSTLIFPCAETLLTASWPLENGELTNDWSR